MKPRRRTISWISWIAAAALMANPRGAAADEHAFAGHDKRRAHEPGRMTEGSRRNQASELPAGMDGDYPAADALVRDARKPRAGNDVGKPLLECARNLAV